MTEAQRGQPLSYRWRCVECGPREIETETETSRWALTADGPPLRRVTVRVGKQGDTVSGVARRFGVPAQSVAHWNQVSTSARFAAGSRVVVYVAQKPAARADKPSRAPAKPARNAARKR